MKCVPEPLAQRYSIIKQIDILNDLLDALKQCDRDTSKEQRFLSEKISSHKHDLDMNLPAIEPIIDSIKGDFVAWIIVRLHYIHGYEWSAISEQLILPERLVKAWCYQAMKKAYRSNRKKS